MNNESAFCYIHIIAKVLYFDACLGCAAHGSDFSLIQHRYMTIKIEPHASGWASFDYLIYYLYR